MSEYLFKSDISSDMALFKELNPDLHGAWMNLHNGVFEDGALSQKEKQLIAVAGAHITRCPYCIRSRVRLVQEPWRLGPGDYRGDLRRIQIRHGGALCLLEHCV